MKAIIVDLDGCLSNHDHRKHLSTNRDWAEYNSKMMEDAPVIPMVELIHAMRERGYTIVICTGRLECYRYRTSCWLDRYGIEAHYLFMRDDGDLRSDYVVKEEMYNILIERGFEIAFAIDDRKSVVDMWRAKGILTLHCADGDFLRETV